MPWVYFNAAGKRVHEKEAVFKGKEVIVDSGVRALPGFASLARTEYHDVHAIGQPDLRKTFKSFAKMRAWFKKHGRLKAK
jgi:hypothetical protein